MHTQLCNKTTLGYAWRYFSVPPDERNNPHRPPIVDARAVRRLRCQVALCHVVVSETNVNHFLCIIKAHSFSPARRRCRWHLRTLTAPGRCKTTGGKVTAVSSRFIPVTSYPRHVSPFPPTGQIDHRTQLLPSCRQTSPPVFFVQEKTTGAEGPPQRGQKGMARGHRTQ